jgi:hypothetical protein
MSCFILAGNFWGKNIFNWHSFLQDTHPNTKDAKSKKKVKGAPQVENEEDEETNKSRPSSHKSLERAKEENVMEFDFSYDLDAEEMWADVPPYHVLGRFTQFRELVSQNLLHTCSCE